MVLEMEMAERKHRRAKGKLDFEGLLFGCIIQNETS